MTELNFDNEKERDDKVDELRKKGVNVYAVGYSPFTWTYSLYFTEDE